MDTVIEIFSSPDSARKNTNKRPRTKPKVPSASRRDHPLAAIVITDSDDDEKDASRTRKKICGAKVSGVEADPLRADHKQNQASSQTVTPLTQLLQPKAGSSSGTTGNIASPNRKQKTRHNPPFLPSDEENEPPVSGTHQSSSQILNITNVDEPLPPQKLATPPIQRSPTPVVDPISGYVARVLEIIPDVQVEHLLDLITKYFPTHGDIVVESVLHILFEDPTYPKVDKKGKRKRLEDDSSVGEDRGKPRPKVDYGSKDREYKGGLHYTDLALEQLMVDFPFIPKTHIRRTLISHHSLYAPTHISLAEEKKKNDLPYIPKARPFVKGKGKHKELYDAEFEKERNWLLLKLQEDFKNDAVAPQGLNEQEDEEAGDGIECGCCFSQYAFDKMIQCPDAHLFCTSCMTTYAETLLGSHDPNLVCMDQSGCKLVFPPSELQRFLSPKLLELYDRVKQTKEIEAAGLEGLEECPFCDYKCVIDNPEEKLFRCGNEDGGCGAISCRQCKKLDHVPKSCKEMEEDKHLGARHAIEEAMTRALMRNCPKCQKAFIKEFGCNKMTCPNCHTISCYICRQIIVGYDHFTDVNSNSSKKCILWDPVDQRHANEVNEAAKAALEEYKRDHPDVDEKDIKVDLLAAPPPAPKPNAQPMFNGAPIMANAPAMAYYPAVGYAQAPAAHIPVQWPVPLQAVHPYQAAPGGAYYNFNLNQAGIAPAPVYPPPIPHVPAYRAPRAQRAPRRGWR